MKHNLVLVLAILLAVTTEAQTTLTKIFIVRHADRLGQDDELNANGIARADELRRVLAGVGIDSIFSTNTVRTTKTAMPLATLRSLPIIKYSTEPEVINRIKLRSPGKRVLVVGHSDTVDSLIKLCGCKPPASIVPNIPGTQFDNLFLVILHKPASPSVRPKCELLHMKYGAVKN